MCVCVCVCACLCVCLKYYQGGCLSEMLTSKSQNVE